MSGDAVIGPPIKKCPGVNADRSRGLEEIGVRGREFNIASMSTITVSNSSYVRYAVDTVRTNKCFLISLPPPTVLRSEVPVVE